MAVELVVGTTLAAVLIVYVLTGGADFGGGVLDLFARGPRADEQRDAIVRAIAPIWEANHVWLIVVVVVLFVCFPVAFAAISTALHIPLTLMLIGIVARGSAFVFQQYDPGAAELRRRWGRIFAAASMLTPFMFGVVFAALASGDIRLADGTVSTGFFAGWTTPFAFVLGAFVVAQVTFLAAAYLANETQDELREDFRSQGLVWGAVLGITAAAALVLARSGAPILFEALTTRGWSLPFQAATGAAAVGALWSIHTRRFALGRLLAAAQVALIVSGGLAAQYPYMVAPDLTVSAAAAPENVLRLTLLVLGVGSIVLLPALAWLIWVFKRGVLLRR